MILKLLKALNFLINLSQWYCAFVQQRAPIQTQTDRQPLRHCKHSQILMTVEFFYKNC
ncbi:hypothetical protein Hanom_Chr05g00442441 [Helianthus anomalus]